MYGTKTYDLITNNVKRQQQVGSNFYYGDKSLIAALVKVMA